jgi:hypothetical protein
MKPVGKPDAGNRHVRFDERGRETGRASASVLAPVLDCTKCSGAMTWPQALLPAECVETCTRTLVRNAGYLGAAACNGLGGPAVLWICRASGSPRQTILTMGFPKRVRLDGLTA